MKKLWQKIQAWINKIRGIKDVVKPKPDIDKPILDDATDIKVDKWLGKNWQRLPVTTRIDNAEIDERWLYTSYLKYEWPHKLIGDAWCDAICCLFYEQGGKIVGGKFDWWRVGGQNKKTLENMHKGYGGHKMPARTTKCWTCIVSVDEKQRSNIQKARWK